MNVAGISELTLSKRKVTMMLETDLQPHIRLGRNQSANYALLPGDPGRVKRIAAFLDDVEELVYNASSTAFVVNTKGYQCWLFLLALAPLYGDSC